MKKTLLLVACVLSVQSWAEDFSKIDQEFLKELEAAEKAKKQQSSNVVTKIPKETITKQTQKNKLMVLRSIEKPVYNRPRPLQIVAVEEYRFSPAPAVIIYQ